MFAQILNQLIKRELITYIYVDLNPLVSHYLLGTAQALVDISAQLFIVFDFLQAENELIIGYFL